MSDVLSRKEFHGSIDSLPVGLTRAMLMAHDAALRKQVGVLEDALESSEAMAQHAQKLEAEVERLEKELAVHTGCPR